MRRLLFWTAFCSLALGAVNAQTARERDPLLAKIDTLWADKDFSTNDVLNLINNRGSDFEMNEDSLSQLLTAARAGSRPPREVATVLLRLMAECLSCRSQLWFPLSAEDIQHLVEHRGSAFTADEIKVRGVKELPHSAKYVNDLRHAGADKALVSVINEKVIIPIPAGFKPMPLQRTPDFNAQADEGRLTLHVEVFEPTEFIFQHNALFYRSKDNHDPKDLGSSFSAYSPMMEEKQVQWNIEAADAKTAKKKKGKESDVVTTFYTDPSGRNGFHVSIAAAGSGRHEYDLIIHWKAAGTSTGAGVGAQ